MNTSINYFIKNNIKYIIYFPEEWIPHNNKSGPENCKECQKKGMINDMFVFYCERCLNYEYNNTRGTYDYFNLIINDIHFEEDLKVYYKLLINNNRYCYGCDDILMDDYIDMTTKTLLCYQCKHFPDFEKCLPIGY